MTSLPPSNNRPAPTFAPTSPTPLPQPAPAPEHPARSAESPKLATLPKKKRGGGVLRTLLQLLLVAGICVGVYFCYGPISEMIKARQAGSDASGRHGHGNMPLPVVVAKAQLGNISIYNEGLGNVTPLNSVTVKTRVSGQLMSLPFQEGQLVKKDDPIAEIDPRPYQVQLEMAQAQLVHDQAVLDNATIDLQRYDTLWKLNSVSQQTLATQQALVAQDNATIGTDQASIDSIKLNLIYCHITSPIDGQVGLRQVDIGNYVQPSDSNGIVVINQIEPITVLFTVSEDSITPILRSLQRGEHLPVTALDRSKSETLAEGTLLNTDNQIDPTTATLRLRAQFDNKDHSLFPNQFVNARLLIRTKQNVLLIPIVAIQTGQNGPFVYAVEPDSTVSVKQVTTGTSDPTQIEVTKGLSPGDTVIIDGVDKLQDGSKVIATTPAASTDSAASETGVSTGTHHHRHHTQDGSVPDSTASPSPAPPIGSSFSSTSAPNPSPAPSGTTAPAQSAAPAPAPGSN